jgi:hypothetical protein
VKDKISILIPTSPLSAHPSTALIEKAIYSVRQHLPNSPIFIMLDGVRKEQSHYTERYVDYIHNLVGHTLLKEKNVKIMPFVEFHHQAAMTRRALEIVKTPLILFLEHDTFFLPDPIDFKGIARLIQSEDGANVVNFHSQAEPWITPAHEHLMLDKKRVIIEGVPVVRTWQWSQRPHVASTAFYRNILNAYFTKDCRTMIEDRMHDLILSHRATFGDENWQEWRLMMYTPEGNIRRTDTLDGRGSDPKYEMRF